MAYDINAMRKGNGMSKEDALLEFIKESGKEYKRQSFLKRKGMSFDEALMEFVAECSRWIGCTYEDMQQDLSGLVADGSLNIMSHVLYTCVLNVLLEQLEYSGHYTINDKSVCDEEGMPILLFKELYINYCLYQYIHSDETEVKEYYKMRAEQGFGCTLDEEVIRRDMEDPVRRIERISPEEPAAEEILYEDTKMWGIDPESKYSFVTCWKTSSDMPKDLIEVLIMFMSTLRDYIDISDICSMSADTFMHTAYVLATKYKIFDEAGIDFMCKLSMMALRFRYYLDQQRKQES